MSIRYYYAFILGCVLSSTSAQASDQARIFLGLDSADQQRATFAIEMTAKTLRHEALQQQAPAARIFVVGEAFQFLISGSSPLESEAKKLVAEKRDFQIIACGKAVPTLRTVLASGKAKLIPAVRILDTCEGEQQSLMRKKWIEVEIPDFADSEARDE